MHEHGIYVSGMTMVQDVILLFGPLTDIVIGCITCATFSSDYVELEAVPTTVNLEGPLERGPIASSGMLEMQDEPLERFLVNYLWHFSFVVGR